MTKVKVFVYGRRRQQRRRRRRGYDNSSPDFRLGELKMGKRSPHAMTPTEILSGGGGGGVITPHSLLKS